MTFSVFLALLQVLLKAESKRGEKVKSQVQTIYHKETIRKESEAIPFFVKRYQKQSFHLWEISFPEKNKSIETNESTKSNKK